MNRLRLHREGNDSLWALRDSSIIIGVALSAYLLRTVVYDNQPDWIAHIVDHLYEPLLWLLFGSSAMLWFFSVVRGPENAYQRALTRLWLVKALMWLAWVTGAIRYPSLLLLTMAALVLSITDCFVRAMWQYGLSESQRRSIAKRVMFWREGS